MDNNYSNYYSKILLSLPNIIAALLSLIAVVFILLAVNSEHYRSINLPIIILLPSVAYLLFRNKISFDESLPDFLESDQLSAITHIIYFLSVSVLMLLSFSNLYYRPPLYFLFILIATTSIILNIFYLNSKSKFSLIVVLIKITILCYIIYSGIYYQFEGIYGTDPWLHIDWIEEIINTGHLSKSPLFLYYYYFFPVFHLYGAITTIITSKSVYSSIFVSCGFLMALSGVLVFKISRTMMNEKAALLVAVILPLTSNNIEKATELIPMSLGYCFILFIIYLIFDPIQKGSINRYLIILLSFVLIFTHPIASLVMLTILIAIFYGNIFYNSILKVNPSNKVFSKGFILFFLITMLAKWMQNLPGQDSFFDLRLSNLFRSLQVDSQFVLSQATQIPAVSYNALLFDQAGYLLLMAFAIIGVLDFIHCQKLTQNRISLVIISLILFIIIYAFYLLHIDSILPYRWYLFLYLPLSILAVAGLLWISSFSKIDAGKLAIIFFGILAIIFTMTTNSLANKESPFFFNNAVRYGYTQSEFASIDTLSDIKAGTFVTDIYFTTIFPYILSDDEYNEMMQSSKSIFIQRNYYLNNPEWNNKYEGSIVKGNEYNRIVENKLILDFMKKQYIIDKSPMIYNNGNVKGYILSL